MRFCGKCGMEVYEGWDHKCLQIEHAKPRYRYDWEWNGWKKDREIWFWDPGKYWWKADRAAFNA